MHHWCLHINFSHWLSHLKAYFPYDSLKFSIISFMLWAYTKHLNLTIGVNIQNIVTTSVKKKKKHSQKLLPEKFSIFYSWKIIFSFQLTKCVFHFENTRNFFSLKTRNWKQKTKTIIKNTLIFFGIINLFLLNQTGPPEAQHWFWPNLFRWRSAFTSL